MKQIFSKTTTIAIIILFIVSMATSITLIPTTSAHVPALTVPTYAFINAAPNPIGIGQQATVVFWLDKVPIGAEGVWGSRWHNMKVTVMKPDGTNETIGTFNSDSNGGASTRYTPTSVGTYTFYFEFPGQIAQNENPYPYFGFISLGLDYVNDTFAASSATTTLTVQQDPIGYAYGQSPLPTQYWARPINSMNREWSVIGGKWLGLAATSFGATGMYSNTGNFAPYTTAPNSAHVMWTQPIAFGGQVGGELGSSETSLYATGTAYEAKFGAVIINGILYYSEYPGAGNNPVGLKAVDIRTGATVWERNITTPLKCGMVNNFITGDQYGAHAYLFCAPASIGFIPYPPGSNWEMYDAMTGAWVLNIANVTAGTLVDGPNGELLSYTIANGKLTMWNSTQCISAGAQKNLFFTIYSAQEVWRPPQGATIDWSAGNQWSVPVDSTLNGAPIIGLSVSKVTDGIVLATATTGGIFGGPPGGASLGSRIDVAYSATTGAKLWGPTNRTLTPFTTQVLQAGEGKYAEYTQQTMTWLMYDLETGQKLWGPSTPVNSSWAYYDFTAPADFAYGNFYTWGLSGQVYCYDATNGNLKWTWYAGNAGFDTPYGTYPLGTWSNHHIIADGKLFVRSGHDYTPPVYKGAKLYCINATDGTEIWSDLSFDIVSSPAVADGYMVWDNGYDNQIYCYGKGPSATTVSAPQSGVELGKSLVISGTVLDISAGTQQSAVKTNFPYGVAAVSDASQSSWMEYIYQQQPFPSSTTGVPVTIDVLDSNGNYRTIGTATSDASGFFSLDWTPDIPGHYTVIATFHGSESYYSSYAEAAFTANAPAATATPQPTQPASMADLYFVPGIIGVIVAIIVVGAVIILALRKRP
jgi:outer membrane protein assembly factor BamB